MRVHDWFHFTFRTHACTTLDSAAQAYVEGNAQDPSAILSTVTPDFCYYAINAPMGTPLSLAADSCVQYEEQTKSVYDHL